MSENGNGSKAVNTTTTTMMTTTEQMLKFLLEAKAIYEKASGKSYNMDEDLEYLRNKIQEEKNNKQRNRNYERR